VLDDRTLLEELDDITTNLNISFVKSEMRQGWISCCNIGQELGHWYGSGQKDAPSDHSKGDKQNDSPKFDQAVQYK
jgi:hypothetical protein